MIGTGEGLALCGLCATVITTIIKYGGRKSGSGNGIKDADERLDKKVGDLHSRIDKEMEKAAQDREKKVDEKVCDKISGAIREDIGEIKSGIKEINGNMSKIMMSLKIN